MGSKKGQISSVIHLHITLLLCCWELIQCVVMWHDFIIFHTCEWWLFPMLLVKMVFDDPTFVNWLFCWSSNVYPTFEMMCDDRHLWWFALSTFHEESARAVSTWYLQAGALNPEDRRRTNGPTMACFGRDQVLRIIKSCVLISDTFILCRIGCHQEYLGGNEHFGLRSMSPRTIQCLGCSREWWVFKGGASESEIKVIG